MKTRYFALVLGIVLLLAGIAGFVPGLVTGPAPPPEGADAAAHVGDHGQLLGLFPVNALHNLFHIAWGIFGIVAYRSFAGARNFARVTAVVYGLLTVLGLIPGLNTVFGLLPIYGHDVWLHALIAIAAAYFGFAAAEEVEHPVSSTTTGRI